MINHWINEEKKNCRNQAKKALIMKTKQKHPLFATAADCAPGTAHFVSSNQNTGVCDATYKDRSLATFVAPTHAVDNIFPQTATLCGVTARGPYNVGIAARHCRKWQLVA